MAKRGVRVSFWGGVVGLAALSAGCTPSNPSGEAVRAAPSPKRADAVRLESSCARVAPGVGPVREGSVRQGSTVALARESERLLAYVADRDRNQISVVDVTHNALVQTVPASGSPEQLLVLADGRVVASIADGAHIEVFEPTGDPERVLESRCARTLPAGPFGLALSPNEDTLVVTSAWEAALSSLDAKDLSLRGAQSLPRSPRGVLVDETNRAFVSHIAGASLSVVELSKLEQAPRKIDLRVKAASLRGENLDLDVLRGGVQGFALAGVEISPTVLEPGGALKNDAGGVAGELPRPLAGKAPVAPKAAPTPQPPVRAATPKAPAAPDGSKAPMIGVTQPGPEPVPTPAPRPAKSAMRLIVPMVSLDPGDRNRPTQMYYGPPPTAGVPKEAPIAVVVDAQSEKSMSSHVLAPTANLRGEECLLPRAVAYRRDAQQLLVTCMGIDQMLVLDARAADPMRAVVERHHVPAGPTGVAIAESERVAVTFGQFDASLAVVSLDGKGSRTIPLDVGASSISPTDAEGRRLFYLSNDTRLTSDGVACASCHPDGGDDGVSWSTPEGMRQTLMLAGRVQGTAPYGWSRKQGTLATYISDTSRRLGGTGLPKPELDSLAAFVKHLPGPPRREVNSALVDEGREVFFSSGCDGCHVAAVGTDARSYEFSADEPSPYSSLREGFDTPSLLNVRATGPYFHDGRYPTLEALLADPSSQMGNTSRLSPQEQTSLKAFLESL